MIEETCAKLGMRLTSQRRAVLQVLGDANDHPSLETIHARAKGIDPTVSLATVYRTLQYLCRNNLALKHNFGALNARYELYRWDHHHLIDVETGRILEIASDSLEAMVRNTADRHGYEPIDHRAELFCRPRRRQSGPSYN
jgi:Fur family ferric uptake transcriptional regulator